MDEKIRLSLDSYQNLKIDMSDELKKKIEADAYAIYQAYTQMLAWFSDSNVSESEKQKYAEAKINLMRSASDVIMLLEMMGYSRAKIDEIFVLPF